MGAGGSVFLGVERSATGRRWQTRLDDDRLALGFAQRHGLPEIVARVLAARCLDEASLPAFLEPKLRDQLPDPAHLKDMDKAAERVASAVGGTPPVITGRISLSAARRPYASAQPTRSATGRRKGSV